MSVRNVYANVDLALVILLNREKSMSEDRQAIYDSIMALSRAKEELGYLLDRETELIMDGK